MSTLITLLFVSAFLFVVGSFRAFDYRFDFVYYYAAALVLTSAAATVGILLLAGVY